MNKRSGADSREKILSAAQEVFSEFGYRGASMRTIAHRAGISVGGVYLYFKNKEELCLTLMKGRLDDLSVALKRKTAGLDDPVEEIKRFIAVNLDCATRFREIILTQSREKGFTFGIDLKKQFFSKQRSLIEDIISRGVHRREFVDCDVCETAKVVLGLLRGFVLSIVVDADNLFSPEECAAFVLRGLRRQAVNEGAGAVEGRVTHGRRQSPGTRHPPPQRAGRAGTEDDEEGRQERVKVKTTLRGERIPW